ncbi:MAG: S1 RNA-binding domain-containing protein [Clostridia bacterium]|nr:S1 RNA-binding domain-containing protein [Clostridia bacterium]
MEYQKFIPEGWNPKEEYTFNQLENAKQKGEILQGFVISCDENYNLHVNCGNNLFGVIPKNEFELENNIKPSIYKNKENCCVQFKVIDISENKILLSRKAVKQEAFEWVKNDLKPGDIVSGIVKNIRPFGAFVEIGGGIVGLLHIEDISVSRIKSPGERLSIGQKINIMIKSIDQEKERICLSYKELLGDWEENIKGLEEKAVVDGIIKEADKYKNGIFVELKPNLVAMAEYQENLKYGKKVKVIIKKIIKSKRKIKVVII